MREAYCAGMHHYYYSVTTNRILGDEQHSSFMFNVCMMPLNHVLINGMFEQYSRYCKINLLSLIHRDVWGWAAFVEKPLIVHPSRLGGGLDPLPAAIGQETGYTPERWAVCHRQTLTFTPLTVANETKDLQRHGEIKRHEKQIRHEMMVDEDLLWPEKVVRLNRQLFFSISFSPTFFFYDTSVPRNIHAATHSLYKKCRWSSLRKENVEQLLQPSRF